jgi:hypothetical protein
LENIGRTNQEALQPENKDGWWYDYLEKILSSLAIFSMISYTKHITHNEAQTVLAILIPPLVGSIILYILVMRPLPYMKPWGIHEIKKSGIKILGILLAPEKFLRFFWLKSLEREKWHGQCHYYEVRKQALSGHPLFRDL